MAVGAVVARILTQYSDKGSKQAQKDIAKLGKRIDAFGKQALKSFGIAAAASAAMAVKIGKDAVKAAIEENQSTAVLTNTLRNYGLATQENIDIISQYIDKQEMLSLVSDNDLRASFGRLITVSGDVTEAMRVQTVALDVAAGTTLDFNTVSKAFEKAVGGNFTALKKILPGIDANIIKNKDLGKAVEYATAVYGGSAEAFGDTDPLKKLSIAYGRVLETLGGALLPVVIAFTEYLTGPGGLIESLQEWVKVNEEELQESLTGVSDLFKLILENSGNLTKALDVLVAVSGLLNTSILGVIKVGEVFFLGGIALGIALKLKKVFGGLSFEALKTGKRFDVMTEKAKNAADKAAKVGGGFDTTKSTKSVGIVRQAVNLLSKRVKIALGLLAGIGAGFSIAKTLLGPSDSELLKQMQEQTKKDFQAAQAKAEKERLAALRAANAAKIAEAARLSAAKAAAEAAAKARKDALAQLKIDKAIAAVRKALRIKGENAIDKETDIIQLNAAEALLKRQKEVDAADLDRLKRMKDEILSLAVRNDLAKRYQDILQALADQKIDTKEIAILAKMWGVPVEAVEAYLATLFAVEDATITDDEIVNLAMKWGSTQAQAAQYLDFYQYLNDGILSDAEIEKLKTKWKMTEEQVRMYADFVGIVNDGKLTDAEIIKIQDKWKLTTDQVVEYIKKIGSPVSYSGTLIDPAKAAEIGWLNATAALQRYLDLLKAGTGVVVPNPITPPVVVPPVVIPPKTDGLGGSKTDSAAAASAASAIAYAVAKAAGDSTGAALAAAGVTPSALASQESGAIGAASIAAQLRAAEEAVKNANTLAAFKAKEAADLAASQAASAQLDYDEKFRFRSMTMANASSMSGGNLMAGGSPVINVTVQGSVTSEQDLVQSIRTGLLRGQYNGDAITLQAI